MPQNDPNAALFSSIGSNDPEGMAAALETGADPNARQGYNHTALSRAVANDSEQAVVVLLNRGADPNARSESGETPLHHSHQSSRAVFSQLIQAGADPNARDQRGITPLHRAVADKRFLSSAQRLLENGADPNVRTNVRGTTPLHWANSDAATTRLLTWKSYPKADPNAPDRQGQTPLHYAISNPDSYRMERYNQVQSLLNGGADPNARNNREETPLHRVALSLRESLAEVSMLLQSGADVRSRDDVGNTPLHYAAGHASVDRCSVVQRLLEKGARPNEQNHAGQTPLHLAAGRAGEGQAEAIRRLLTDGADPNIADAKGQTPINVASPTAQEIFARRYNSPEQKERRAMHDRAANEAPNKPNRVDEYHQQFADQIVEQIRQDNAPWQKPWKPGEDSLPKNLSSDKEYRGGNSMYLAVAQGAKGYSDNRWGTYKQIQAAGGQVRKGERGTRILSFQDHKQIAVTDKAGKPVHDAEGNKVYRYERLNHPMVRQYTVFNADQADGLKLPERPSQQPEWKAHENAEAVIRASGVRINHVQGDRAFYNLQTDKVTLPERGQFPSATHYYQTALHELGHATGHESRLNRPSLQEGVKAGFGSEAYAKEELRAEISAMMSGQRVGVGHDPPRGAAYVEGWLKALKDDPREIYRAASEAQKMSDHLVAPMREKAAEQEKKQGELAQKYSHQNGPQISHTPTQPAQAPERAPEREVTPSR